MASASPTQPSTTTTAAKPSADTMAAPAELAAVVDDLLDSLGAKFTGVSKEIYDKLEAMGKRLDSLEAAITHSSSGTAAGAGEAGGAGKA